MTAAVSTIARPADVEYNAFYAGYVSRVKDEDVFGLWARQIDTLNSMLGSLSAEQAEFRHAPNEWSIKEVVGHINDTERVFAYRTLRISRNDQAPLHGFDQDDYVRESNFGVRTLPDLLEEFELLRRANLLMFNKLTPEMIARQGTASGYPVTVRALLYIIAGHVEHHVESLNTDYLPKLNR